MDRDRVREIERRVYELEDITARLPVTFPTNVSQPLTLYLGQPLSNVTPSTDVFTLTNLTRFPSGEAPESIEAKNTQDLEVSAGEKKIYVIEVIVDGEVEYWTWGPGAPGEPSEGGSGTVPFQLTADKPNNFPYAEAVLLNAAGLPISGGEIVVVDKTVQSGSSYPSGRFGLAQYTGADGSTQPGYLGECRPLGIANYGGTGLPGYEIVSMEGPAEGILVEIVEDGPMGDGELTVDVNLIQCFGSNECARMPQGVQVGGSQSTEYNMAIVDTQKIVSGLRAGELLVATRDHRNNVYRATSADPSAYYHYDAEETMQAFVHESGLKQWVGTLVCNVSP